MLIINADDFGSNVVATDNILTCFKNERITSASAMVFMADSERAAEFALQYELDVGLHLNFTCKFSGRVTSSKLIEYQIAIAGFLQRNKYCPLLYNPLMTKKIAYVYNAQYDDFYRLYNRHPSHVNGHHHMHLCMNMIVDAIIPSGLKVRRNFTFAHGGKNLFNRLYRNIIDTWLKKHYICTDFFYSISPISQDRRIRQIINLSNTSNVELMVHPERQEEYFYLMSEEYHQLITGISKGTYAFL
jgi:chitin disaccharide deacetylase